MKKIALFAGIGVALVAITAAAMYFVLAPKMAAASAAGVTATPPPHYTLGPTYTMQSRVVNLADPGANRYLKITVMIEFSPTLDKQGDVTTKATAREPVLQDILTTVLGDMTTTQLATSQGKDALKKTLMSQFAPILVELHIINLYFPDFVMQ